MAFDLYHYFGGDVASSVTGDLQLVDGTEAGQQRILRRLLTAVDGYIWHLNYGGGLGEKIGNNADIPAIQALIQGQMNLEGCAAQDPAPVVTVTPIQGGLAVHISYVDAVTSDSQILSFDVSV